MHLPSGLPLLLAAALLIVGAGVALFARDDFATEELIAAVALLAAGLVTFGAWLAMEVAGLRQRQWDDERDGDG